jgi:hypothetical protein
MNIFGISILPAKAFNDIFDKAVMAGHQEDLSAKTGDRLFESLLLNRKLKKEINDLKEALQKSNAVSLHRSHQESSSETLTAVFDAALDLSKMVNLYIQTTKD